MLRKNKTKDTPENLEEETPDVLPDDLNPDVYVGPYLFPNNNRRKIPGALYLFLAIIIIAVWAINLRDSTPLTNYGFLIAGIALLLLGLHHIFTGWDLEIDENEAFEIASNAVGFEVGNASAQMGWRGWVSRPTWRVLLFSNEPVAKKKALVLIDGGNGRVLECLASDNI